MPVQQPPITGDPQVDSFNQQVADALNTMPLGNVITEQTVIATDIAGARGAAGADGINRATVFIYQRTGLNETAGLTPPARLSDQTVLQYNYDNSSLLTRDSTGAFTVGPPWEGWYPTIPDRDPVARNDYVWFQSVNIADRDNTDLIAASEWSGVGLFTRPGLGALRAVVDYNLLVDGEQDPDEQTYEARITHLYLGELDITAQIAAGRICWLIAEAAGDAGGYPPGSFAVDQQGFAGPNIPDTYSDRNFVNGSPRRVGYTAEFPATEIFQNNTPGTYSTVSRDIEPRIDISTVINI